jgi:hypothetical protein
MPFQKGNTLRLGIKHSESTKNKIGLSRKDKVGEKSSNWKGGRMIVGGYVYIYHPLHPNRTIDGYVAEHRLVIEKKIGRLLKRNEVVHHINEIKDDNMANNLALYSCCGEHTKENHINRDKNNGRFKKKT